MIKSLPLKVCIWRNETCWQIHHNLAELFYFWFIITKWSSLLPKEKERSKGTGFFFPFRFVSKKEKKKTREIYPRKATSPSFAFSKWLQKWSEIIWRGKTFRLNIYSLVMEGKESKKQRFFLRLSLKRSRPRTKWRHNASTLIAQE